MRSWSILPSKPAAQLASFSLLFFGTLMYWHWEAMLISYLATRVIVMPFNDIPELVSDTDFKIILVPSSSYEDAFKFSKNPDWQSAWTQRWVNLSTQRYTHNYLPITCHFTYFSCVFSGNQLSQKKSCTGHT